MNVKQWLMRARDIDREINSLLKEKQEQERRKPLPDNGERTAEKILEDFAKTL